MKLQMATKVTGDEWWTASAMAQDALVADLLLRIRHSTKHQATRPNSSGKLAADLVPAGWGVRQPRSVATLVGSRSVTQVSEPHRSRKMKEKIGRRSPSTPLSWSGGGGGGGGGGSGGVDGWEASSSRSLHRSPKSRSKTSLAANEVNPVSTSKARKKKTYAELREEECMLLQERIYLNQELALLGATVKEQIAENENLKRIKLDLSTLPMKNPNSSGAPAAEHTQCKKAMIKASARWLSSASHQPSPYPKSCNAGSEMSTPTQTRADFALPDLNMMPSELDSTS